MIPQDSGPEHKGFVSLCKKQPPSEDSFNLMNNDLPDVLFFRNSDGVWNLGWGFMESSATAPSQPSFFLPDFFLKDPSPWWKPQFFQQTTDLTASLWWQQNLAKIPLAWHSSQHPFDHLQQVSPLQHWSWQEPQKEEFAAIVKEVLLAISSGLIQKVVPVVMARAPRLPHSQEILTFFHRLKNLPHDWMIYGGWWNHGQEGLLGASPEKLFTLTPESIETMALAGTAARSQNLSLLHSPKDLHEHQIVVQDLVKQLQPYGWVQVDNTAELLLGSLKHLCTFLKVKGSSTFENLIQTLHPTPALGVSPRGANKSWLQMGSYAPLRRRFGAPFGVYLPEHQTGHCCVAIRNIQWHLGETWLGSGCGLVAGSQLDHEWQELQLKRKTVMAQLGLT